MLRDVTYDSDPIPALLDVWLKKQDLSQYASDYLKGLLEASPPCLVTPKLLDFWFRSFAVQEVREHLRRVFRLPEDYYWEEFEDWSIPQYWSFYKENGAVGGDTKHQYRYDGRENDWYFYFVLNNLRDYSLKEIKKIYIILFYELSLSRMEFRLSALHDDYLGQNRRSLLNQLFYFQDEIWKISQMKTYLCSLKEYISYFEIEHSDYYKEN